MARIERDWFGLKSEEVELVLSSVGREEGGVGVFNVLGGFWDI